MRKTVAAVVSVFAILGLLAAEARAQAPAPKVTINGLVDFVTSAYENWSGSTPSLDPTNPETGWYSRERGVFTITGEVGRTKGVLALEFDFTNGVGATFPGTSSNFDLDTDVAGFVETKWLYVETPITGPGSVIPFIPVSSVLRAGAQPFRGHDYKFGILASGDFPGVTLETTWAPTFKTTLTYAQLREQTDELLGAGQHDSFAILFSPEVEIFKGLTVKPTYAYAFMVGGTGNAFLGSPATDQFNVNGTDLKTHRHTLGGDIRWVAGPFSVQPTVYYQWGDQEINAAGDEVDISAWIVDTIAGFRTGPLNIEGRIIYTTGQDADEDVQTGDDVNYYRPLNPGFAYLAGWSEIWTGGVDYATALLANAPGVSMRTSPSYDKYGRIFLALAADYALTPALTLKALANISWTDKEVDTDGTITTLGRTSPTSGDDRYLGTEVAAGLTYRFAPNVAFDLVGSTLFAGDALNVAGEDANNVYKGSARIRFTF